MDMLLQYIGVAFILSGVYILYAFFKMRKTGVINDMLLMNRQFVGKKCKDPEEFIKQASPATLTLGVTWTLYGIIDVINMMLLDSAGINVILNLGGLVILLGILVWYNRRIGKLRKQFF